MGAGYTRQALANIANGLTIFAADINNEFNAVQSAFSGTSGHAHDGSIGNGPKINLTTSISGVLPVVNGGSGGINNFSATTAPTVNSDNTAGYAVGSEWINTSTSDLYQCINASTGAAVWQRTENYSANLASIAGLASATDTVPYFTGPSTAALASFTAAGRSLVAGANAAAQLTTLGVSAFVQTILNDVDAATVRSTIGTVIGTNVQAWDAGLDALAAMAAPNGLVVQTATDTFTKRTLTGTAAEVTVTNGDGVAGAPTISLPSSLTFTGKTVTGGTFNSGAFNGTLGATTPAAVSGTTGTFSGAVSGTTGTFSSNVTSSANFISSTTAVVLANTGAGTVFFRPNGAGSTTGQATIDSSGNLTAAAGISGTTGTFSGAVSGTTGTFSSSVSCNGLTCTGFITTNQNLSSSTSFLVMGPTGAGSINFRPNGVGSTTGQGFFDSSGNLSVAGSVTATGGLIAQNLSTFSTSGTEVARVDSTSLNVGKTSPALGTVGCTFFGTGSSTGLWQCTRDHNIVGQFNVINPVGTETIIEFHTASTAKGSVTINGTTTAYNTTSDARLKTNPRSFDSGSLIDKLNIYHFDWKAGGTGYGVYAQEAYEVFPDAVVVGNEEKMWQVDYSKFVPLLLQEVKNLREEIERLKDELKAR